MNITCRSSLCKELKNKVLLLDITALVSASKYDVFNDFIVKLYAEGSDLRTLPSAEYEFTPMAKDEKNLQRIEGILSNLGVSTYNLDDEVVKNDEVRKYLMVYNNCVNRGWSERKAPSFTDSLFCVAMYLDRMTTPETLLMTGNSSDIPLQFFDRDAVLAIDSGKEIHVEAIYSFNRQRYIEEYRRFFKI